MRATGTSPEISLRALVADRPRELLVAGHINLDWFLRVSEFPQDDRTVPVLASRVELGGTAANLALTAARYGVASGLVARVGEGFTPPRAAPLRAARIDLRGVTRVRGRPTPVAFILEDAHGAQRTLLDQGAMADRPTPPFRVPSGLNDYAWLHLTTGPPASHLRLLEVARARGLHVAADPAQEIHYRWSPALLRRLLAGSEILFGNRSEIERAQAMLGARTPEELLAWVPLVVRTEGEKGVTAFSRRGVTRVTARRPRRQRSIVGAGDAFRGGFYSGWFEGAPLDACLTAGTRAAARWIEGQR